MQALEKILEEINQEKLKHWDSSERLDTDKLIGWCFDKCIDIIRKHMNDGWNPANKPPETGRRCLVKMKHHAWVSDYESKTIPESEKVYHAEYVEICEAIYLGNNEWKYLCLESEIYESTAFTKPYPTLSAPLDEVIEWKYMPQLQPETCKYTGGSCCWPIDQCVECPNHPERSEE